MQKFEYRAPRFAVDLPVRLTIEGATVTARCREISKEGMRVELSRPLPSGKTGVVAVSFQNAMLELNVRIAHADASHVGLVFVYETDRERTSVARLVSSMASDQTPDRPGPMLLN